MSSPDTSLPTLDKNTSKKSQILRLAAAGHSDRAISAQVGTSEGYVAKVKSEAKRAALQGHPPPVPDLRLISSARGTSGTSTSSKTSLQTRLRQLTAHSPLISIRPQSPIIVNNLRETNENAEVRKELWKKFAQKVPIIEIIKETGLNPAVVWSEFEYFLQFTDRDPYALCKDAMDYLSNCVGKADQKEIADSYQKLAEKYNANGYLSNRQFSELLALLVSIGYQTGIDAVASKDVRPPKGWVRPPCSICKKPMSKMVANPTEELGKKALESVSAWCHSQCVKRSNEPATT